MIRDTTGLDAVSLLAEIRDELRLLNASLATRPAAAPDLVVAVYEYLGSAARFSAAELIASGDATLAAAIGERSAVEVGRVLSASEGVAVRGQRLVREGRGVDGVVWCFR